jgi:exodeoxyribonuclease-3
MKIATFNINGIKARQQALLDWLAEAQPDVACLQEIKSVDEAFPREAFESLGYTVETHGMKAFHGVAILSKLPLEDVTRRLPGQNPDGTEDEQTRWIEATVMGKRPVRVCGLYLPNGNPAPGPKYDYKLGWLDRMLTRTKALLALEEPLVLCGDYNVIPQAEDAANPKDWLTDALYLPQTREAYQRLLNLGLTDAIRAENPAPGLYTFWDFQRGAWERNNGIRIDHLLLSPQAADLLTQSGIDKAVRGRDKPSDHVPTWIELDA